jgi:hypothetical protein
VLTVRFEDKREEFKALLLRKVAAATAEAARVLSDTYQEILSDPAPPHSMPGEIPHAYFGHKEGGYGPVNGYLQPNNTSSHGFNGTQITFLKNYIDSSSSSDGSAVVGFSPSHVTTREKNYLIGWDQGRIDGASVPQRPWINPGFEMAKQKMRQFAAVEFRATR